jgi:hypothetical protein
VFLGTSWSSVPPASIEVFGGVKTEFTLTLTSAELIQPQLRAGLFAVSGTLVAPLATDLRPELHRQGGSQPGVQRFTFNLDIPAVQRRQALMLHLQVQTVAGAEWLSLPAVAIEAVLSTWQESLRQFAARFPIGRVNGGDQLASALTRAGINAPDAEADALTANPSVRVWFAEVTDEQTRLTAAPGVVMVVFKPGVHGGLEITRTGPTINVLVESSTLSTLDRDPAAQNALERALATVAVLLPVQAIQP